MPIYEYECTACRIRFERAQRVHDEPVKTCPECDRPTRRVFHPVGIIFKGSGFYVTDQRKSHAPPYSPSSSQGDEKNSDGAGGLAESASSTASEGKKPESTASVG